MVHWEWLVPVFFLIFWIVSSLLQGMEKERARANRTRSLPGGDRLPGERPGRRPPTDIDRFLEEVNRRRRQAAERRPAPVGREKAPGPTVGPVAATPRSRGSTRAPSGAPVVPVQPLPPPPGKIPEAIPVLPAATAAEVLAVASALHGPPVQSLPSAAAAPPATPSSAAAANAPSALPPLDELLRNADNLRTAIILHEILGPPRSRRSQGLGW